MTDTYLTNSDPRIAPRYSLYNGRQSIIKPVAEQKICPHCDESIDIDDLIDHTTECTGRENILPDALSSSIHQSFIYDDDDDHGELATNSAGLENTLLSSIEQTLLDDTVEDDHSEQSNNDVGPENALFDAFQQSLDDEKLLDDHAKNTANYTGLENTLPDTTFVPSIEQSVVYKEFNVDSTSHFRPITRVDDDEDNDDVFFTPDRTSPETIDENAQKYCILCYNMIDESKFVDHIASCSESSPIIRRTDKKAKIYSRKSRSSTDDEEDSSYGSFFVNEERKDCIICSKSIQESEYVKHVHACLTETTTSEPIKKETAKCFSCHRSVNTEDFLSREISCPSDHIYCLSCLQHSMEEFARNRLTPLCHLTLCNYELSRHDISLIPLERRISDRLFQLAKGEQRPQCPKCHFYIDINENEYFDDHVDVCEDLIPCEYCSCPYSIDQLENHTARCRRDQSSQNEKLINFLLKRTKYPLTKEQISSFIQQKKKENYSDLDPLSIVDALAVFGTIFPYDIRTRECDVCMKACLYEDIYVFGCADNHKLCYSCYYKSCQTKMSNGEMLTCGLCPTPLRDGELNQLRISDRERKKIRDYQMKKTLDDYSNHTRGIIKCPNQKCSWIAEAEDPTVRFKVQCPLCQREFCSLCNEQYHYRTKCQELPHITEQWYFWCQTERTRYFNMRAREDALCTARLNEYNRQMNDNENRNKELRRRYEELLHDEEYKIQHCRHCPSCKRVVERLQGCHQMICGQDAHGGNVQSGCGTKFNWTHAQPYTTTTTFHAQQSIIDLPKPENPIVEHIGVICDTCRSDINGIRFDCIHCPSLIYCEKCEEQATLKHSHENQRINQQSHVFRLIMTPEETSAS